MDEPFGSLDSKIKIRLQKFLLAIWKKYKMTILFVTHDIHEAIRLGQRIIIMNDNGKIVSDEIISRSGENISENQYFELYRKYYTFISND